MTLALALAGVLVWALSHGRQSGRHQRSSGGPVRGDGSGWTKEALALDAVDHDDFSLLARGHRGPEDDPDFIAELGRRAGLRRPEPPADA